MNLFRTVQFRALLIALFAFYVAPVVPLVVLSSIPFAFDGTPPVAGQRMYGWRAAVGGLSVVLWFWALAPVGSGYVAAKLAKQQPLLHGLLAGTAGAVLAVVFVRGELIFELVLALIIASSGLFGGWLWRYRHRDS